MEKIAIVGVGGRTGTMFTYELRHFANVLGVTKEEHMELIAQKKLYIQRKKQSFELFDCKVIKDSDFEAGLAPDIVFITTKNPVYNIVKYYFEKFKNEKIPALFISQNGINALSEARQALKEVFGKEAENIQIIRCILFNPIDSGHKENNIYIRYSLPIRIAVSKAQGYGDIKKIVETFKSAGFEVSEFSEKNAKNLEFSKLFLNLIGMASASHGFSIRDGFKNKEIFKEEVQALKEYIKVVKKSHGKFLNFSHYPVKFLSIFIELTPIFFLMPVRNILSGFISKERGGKLKDLDEISYYNGGVVKLGKKIGVETLINEKVYKRVLKGLEKKHLR